MFVEDGIDIDLGIIGLNDLSVKLNGANRFLDSLQLLFGDLACLIEQDDVTELELLDDEGFDALLPFMFLIGFDHLQGFSASEFVPQP